MAATKIVAITGCDSGFGREAAKTLAEKGWSVVAGCFTADGVKSIEAEKGTIKGVQVDVTNDKSVVEFAKQVEEVCNGRGLHGLINNAGIAPTGFVEWAPLEDLQKAMDINVYGQIRTTKALCPLIRKAQGRIVNVSSICGRYAFGGAPWYSCTKFAVEGWTDSLRREMRPFGVTVHLVEPGFFKTSMVSIEQYSKALDGQWAALTDETKKAYGEQSLTGYVQNIKDQVEMLADPDTTKVVTAMVRALEDRFAKVRYPVGGSARFLFLTMSHLPVWIADGLSAGMNQKYNPDGTVSRALPRRLDLVALWLVGVPTVAAGLCKLDFSTFVATSASTVLAWCLSWSMS